MKKRSTFGSLVFKVGRTLEILLDRGQKQSVAVQDTWDATHPTFTDISFENNVVYGWRRNELIFACVDMKANAAAHIKLGLFNKNTEQEIDRHPILDLLNAPNPYMDMFDLLASIVTYQHLAGRAVYEVRQLRTGLPAELHPLRPDWIEAHSRGNERIAYYTYKPPGKQPIQLQPEQVFDLRLFDPIDQMNGWPPVAVAGRVGDIHNAQTDYLKKHFDEGGVPPGLLKTEQRVNADKIQQIRELWLERYAGWRDWRAPVVLGQGYEYQKIGSPIPELGIEIIDARAESLICSIMKVPPIIVGAKVGLDRSTFSNYQEARTSWWEDTIRPMFEDIISAFNNQLTARYSDQIELRIDYSDVPAFQEDEGARFDRAVQAVRGGWMTVNEAREYVGLDEIPGAAGDVFLRNLTLVEVPMKQVRDSLTDTRRQLTDTTDDVDELVEASANGRGEHKHDHKPVSKLAEPGFVDEFDDERVALEKRMEADLMDFFNEMSADIEAAIREHYGEGGG